MSEVKVSFEPASVEIVKYVTIKYPDIIDKEYPDSEEASAFPHEIAISVNKGSLLFGCHHFEARSEVEAHYCAGSDEPWRSCVSGTHRPYVKDMIENAVKVFAQHGVEW